MGTTGVLDLKRGRGKKKRKHRAEDMAQKVRVLAEQV